MTEQDAAAPDSHLRRIVAGKYFIESVLGKGGMGAVYKAMHLGLGEPVAIKFLHPMFAAVDEVRARFRREATALARLRHPSIVTVLDYGEEEGEPYIVMELVKGTTLSDLVLTKLEEMELGRIGRVFDQVLEVMEIAHASGIVHRDSKLENVMLVIGKDGAERAKVLDFGLAHVEGVDGMRITQTGTVRGTPHYMSPEQCRGRNVGPPTDIYAIGIMLYEALVNEPPFDAKDTAQLLAQHLFVEPAPPSMRTFTRDLSAGMDSLVMRALSKTADARPTATEMRKLLAEAIAGADERTLAAADELERARVGALTRAERAVGTQADAAPDATPLEGRVLLWGLRQELGSELLTALAMVGVRAYAATGDAVPKEAADAATRALVLADHPGVVERMKRAVEAAKPRRLPALVLEVSDAARTAQLVREGAADVAHVSVTVADLVKKVRRLVKRGR